MFIPYSVMNPLMTVRVPRRLPRPGEILVRSGDSVEPSHIVAQTQEPADFRIVDVARDLDVPVKKANTYLKVKRGQSVKEGDVLAARGGLASRVSRAPITGTIVGSGRGRLLLEAEPTPIRLNALVPGIVVETMASEGIIVETVGAMVQATWGNGQESYGVLRIVVRAPRHPLRPKHINASAQGAILIGGASVDEETLEQAIEMQVRGIIVGSISPFLIPRLQTLDFPVVTTEGMGDHVPMSKAAFDLLRSLDGREAAVSGVLGARWSFERPYIVVPMPTQVGRSLNANTPLAVGDRVRVLRGQYVGTSGEIASLPTGLIQLDTGARQPGAEVDVGGNETVLVPFANLERLL